MSRGGNPTGQLPGTGIPSGSDSGLHGTSREETLLYLKDLV